MLKDTSQPKQIEKNAKSVNDALEAALKELNVTIDDVEYVVLDEGAKGFLGMGARDAVVRVTVKEKESEKSSAVEFLSSVFDAMGLDIEIKETQTKDSVAIELFGDNMGIVIGKRGDTLDALQYLTSLVVNQNAGEEKYKKVTVDTEGYRAKRLESLEELAKRLAEKVEKNGRKFTLEPMSPYERRIIHSTLQNYEKITTYSIGDEPERRVVIAVKNEYHKPSRRHHSSGPKNSSYTKPAEGYPAVGGYNKANGTGAYSTKPLYSDFSSYSEAQEENKE